MSTIPKDPVILLSYVNTQLRDNYSSLDEMCQALDVISPGLYLCCLVLATNMSRLRTASADKIIYKCFVAGFV